MTLHDMALDWVASKVCGVKTHFGVGFGKKIYKVGRLEPDIVEGKRKIPSVHKWHEVEVLNLHQQKLESYRKYKNRKYLWIVLPKGTSEVFSIRLIEALDFGRFKELTRIWTGRRL